MEVYAGFVEHVDVQAGKVVDELDRLGIRDNTIIFYIWGDNGSSAEGQQGTLSELLAQNNIPNTIDQHLDALNRMGGLDALGGPKFDNMYHAGWAWAGNAPFQHTKLVASHFGGTRNPMAVSWPARIEPDAAPRQQFHHVNDIVPTIYEVLGIKAPAVVDGFAQDPIDGTSLAYTFADAKAPGRKRTQYFENSGSRGIYQDGWYAGAFGAFVPWDAAGSAPKQAAWDSTKDEWELYHVAEDFSQANNLAAKDPKRLEELKAVFLEEAKKNKAFPIGAGNYLRIHPEDRIKSPYTSWQFDATTTRMPEFTAPGLGRESTHVTIDAELGPNATGVLYALGGGSGGLTLFMDKGRLVYEYNMMIIERYSARSSSAVPRRQAHDRGRHHDRQARRARRGRPQRGRQGSRPHHGQAHRPSRLHGQRVLRCRRRPGIARLAGVLRPQAVQVQRPDSQRGRDHEIGPADRPTATPVSASPSQLNRQD